MLVDSVGIIVDSPGTTRFLPNGQFCGVNLAESQIITATSEGDYIKLGHGVNVKEIHSCYASVQVGKTERTNGNQRNQDHRHKKKRKKKVTGNGKSGTSKPRREPAWETQLQKN